MAKPKMPNNVILGVDPGTTHTAFAVYAKSSATVVQTAIIENHEFLANIHSGKFFMQGPTHLGIEMMASQGMAVGQSTFETATWIGRFIEAWLSHPGNTYEFIYRLDEKLHLCNSPRAKDGNIRQAIMDRYGSTRQLAIGTKKNPGPLYGVASDMWAAIAVALVTAECGATERRGKGSLIL